MLLKRVVLPLAVAVVAAGMVSTAPRVSPVAEPRETLGRMVSRTMPPSDPKPGGPKRPKVSAPILT